MKPSAAIPGHGHRSRAITEFTDRVQMETTLRSRQTPLVDFLDDLLTFLEEKISEAIADPASQIAATHEAAGAMPIINDRLREDDVLWLRFDLVLGVRMEARHWREWWDQFATMKRADFLSEASRFVGHDGMIAILRTILRQ